VQSFSWVSGTTYTVSIFAKKAGRNFIFRVDTSSFSANGNATFNLDAGTVSFGTPFTAATITDFGDGWYRCTATATANATVTNQNMYIDLIDEANSRTYTGDGTSGLHVWGAQLEAASFATSYIPTVASQVTRSADVATMTGTNFSSWYNQSEGSFVMGLDYFGGTQARALATGVLSAGPYVALAVGTQSINGTGWFAGGLNDGAVAVNTVVNKAIAFNASGSFSSVLNGGTVTSSSSSDYNGTATRLNIGGNSVAYLNGHIRQIAYYNTRLPNATLQTITAPQMITTLSLDFINGIYDA
jgi:hypothetical protein